MAEDVVQETFIKAIKKIDSIQDKGKLAAWLSVIARRTAIDMIRSEHQKKGILMEQDMLASLVKEMDSNVEEEVEITFLKEQVRKAIFSLANIYKDVMVLKVNHGLKEQEIAQQLNVNPSSVKTRINRARKRLKVMIKEQVRS